MDELDALQSRLRTALAQLEQAVADGALGGGNSSAELAAAATRISTLESENRDLAKRLDKINKEREQDIAQLDGLIARLRPLVEESA